MHDGVLRAVCLELAGGVGRQQGVGTEGIGGLRTVLIHIQRIAGVDDGVVGLAQLITGAEGALGMNNIILSVVGKGAVALDRLFSLGLEVVTEILAGELEGIGGLRVDVEGLGALAALFERVGHAVKLKGRFLAAAGRAKLRLKGIAKGLAGVAHTLFKHGVGADKRRGIAEFADLLRIDAAKRIDVVTELGDLVELIATAEEIIAQIVGLHDLDAGVHIVLRVSRNLHGIVENIAVVGRIVLGLRVIDVHRVVLIENLLLSIRIENRAEEGEHEHGQQKDRSENREAVAGEALQDLTARRKDLDAGYVVQMDFLIAALLLFLSIFLFQDLIQIIRSHPAPPYCKRTRGSTAAYKRSEIRFPSRVRIEINER